MKSALRLTAPDSLPDRRVRPARRGVRFLAAAHFAGLPDPRTAYSAFYVIFARDEVLGLALVAAFSLGAAYFFFAEERQPCLIPDAPMPLP